MRDKANFGLLSAEKLRVFDAVVSAGGWVTPTDVAKTAGVAPRTARFHATRFAAAGIFDKTESVYPTRFRIGHAATKPEFSRRLAEARQVFGETQPRNSKKRS